MIIRYGVVAISALVLGGCASAPSGGTWVNYACNDGQQVQAAYPDSNTATIKLRGETHTLHIAIAGSGARYVGDGWQWWTKGMHDGMLAPLAAGESVASAPAVVCHAD